MEKYKSLIGRIITLTFNKSIVNSGKILKMKHTPMSESGLEKLFRIFIDWKNKEITNGFDFMDFDIKTLDDFIQKGFSISPMSPDMILLVDGNYAVGETIN